MKSQIIFYILFASLFNFSLFSIPSPTNQSQKNPYTYTAFKESKDSINIATHRRILQIKGESKRPVQTIFPPTNFFKK